MFTPCAVGFAGFWYLRRKREKKKAVDLEAGTEKWGIKNTSRRQILVTLFSSTGEVEQIPAHYLTLVVVPCSEASPGVAYQKQSPFFQCFSCAAPPVLLTPSSATRFPFEHLRISFIKQQKNGCIRRPYWFHWTASSGWRTQPYWFLWNEMWYLYGNRRQGIKKYQPSAWSLRDYPCEECGKTFTQSHTFHKHKKYHCKRLETGKAPKEECPKWLNVTQNDGL